MAKAWRLILDDKLDGPCNMAADETLLRAYETTRIPLIRIYGWQRAYISLGYNQKPEQVLRETCLIPFVRRLTGGASILHDQEITYSLCCSRQDLSLPAGVKDSYRVLCSFLIDFYRRLGLSAYFARDRGRHKAFGYYGNFCFSSREHFDLMINAKKIGGNAQRRRHDVIFQHGSIPQVLDFSRIHACINDEQSSPETVGALDDVLDEPTDFTHLREVLAEAFKETFNLDYTVSIFNAQEKSICDFLMRTKYNTREWNYQRDTMALLRNSIGA